MSERIRKVAQSVAESAVTSRGDSWAAPAAEFWGWPQA